MTTTWNPKTTIPFPSTRRGQREESFRIFSALKHNCFVRFVRYTTPLSWRV